MTKTEGLRVGRFLETLEIVFREGAHLAYSWQRVYSQPIDSAWVRGLATNPDHAETLEAFVSRFGRMQDTIAGRLLPRWLLPLAEIPGSQIEVLNRAERLGVAPDVQRWLEARPLRNRLIYECTSDPKVVADDRSLAKGYTWVLMDT